MMRNINQLNKEEIKVLKETVPFFRIGDKKIQEIQNELFNEPFNEPIDFFARFLSMIPTDLTLDQDPQNLNNNNRVPQ